MPGGIRLDVEWALLPLLVIVPAIVWHGARTHAGRWTGLPQRRWLISHHNRDTLEQIRVALETQERDSN
jgi:hypothetical protein